jgi:hypothetical protein
MSILQEVIGAMSENHNLMPGIDFEKKREQNGICSLSSGIEYSFVNLFCQEIFRRLPQENLPSYHQVFYVPNLQAEARVGYDLSIGHFHQNFRIRTMHKVINERYCDQDWSFRFHYSRNANGEYSGDYGHFIKLTGNDVQVEPEEPNVNVFPFMVLNICFCIHDYRRMGLNSSGQIINPPFDSLLRTVIINLQMLRSQINQLGVDFLSQQFYVRIFRMLDRKLPEEAPQDFLSRINSKENIHIDCCGREIESRDAIMSFDEFIQTHNWAQIMQLGID